MVMTLLSIMCALSLVWCLFLSVGIRVLNQELGKQERRAGDFSHLLSGLERAHKSAYDRLENLDVELDDTAMKLSSRIEKLHNHWDEELIVIRTWNAVLQEYERRLNKTPVKRVRKVKNERAG